MVIQKVNRFYLHDGMNVLQLIHALQGHDPLAPVKIIWSAGTANIIATDEHYTGSPEGWFVELKMDQFWE